MAKTRDGLKLTDILSAVKGIPGVIITSGKKHPYLLKYQDMIACPVAESTHAKRMLVPWLYQATGMNKQQIYLGLKKGTIYN